MDQKKISRREQKCIGECILTHWSESSKTSSEQREEEYEQCLHDCQLCA